ncbi:metallophosphoesterase [Desulfobulbus propionicus DSM 2032]|uniref:Metallophosphoesterase n=1 Tax=Desulfobulbus propionicus (strain ATCC 33891 / DSM 2032 / VKM B-1956 / 1pr3) TaxID=577650 RepID=A0A7U4DNP0_DESPD|nr:metallophosphoesterase [Desulfobulbus propionicus]ADW17127.1 metallophosphoesterase [Desulfobulbus propionicus DSM 2032]
MRLAILADIHGNYRALEAVLADVAHEGADRIVSLGDNIGYGPEPEEVVRALQGYRVVSVMGNHELGLVSRSYFNRLHAAARDSLTLTRSLLSEESLAWLRALPLVRICCGARLVHGSPPQSATVYLHAPTDTRLRRLFASYPERLCFAGHTHAFGCYWLDQDAIGRRSLAVARVPLVSGRRYLILPGSVGQPRDSLGWQAKYLLWDVDEDSIEVRALAYDVHTTIHLLGERGFPATNAKRLFW